MKNAEVSRVSIGSVLLLGSAIVLGSTALLGGAAPAAAQTGAGTVQGRPFTAEDMLSVVSISGSVSVSPDGGTLAFVLPDLTDEWNVGARTQVGAVHVLELFGTPGRSPRRVGPEGQHTSLPTFSPDGTRIAMFVQTEGGSRLAVSGASGENVRMLGSLFQGTPTRPPQWADSDHIVYARPGAPAPQPETPRVRVLEITDPLPGDAFFRREVRSGLAVVDLRTETEQRLEPDGGGLVAFSVSPVGGHVMVRSAPSPLPRLWSVGEGTTLVPFSRVGEQTSWMPDGSILLRLGQALARLSPENPSVRESLTDALSVRATTLLAAPGSSNFLAVVADPTVSDPEIEPGSPGMYTIARPFWDLHLLTDLGAEGTNLTDDLPDQIRSPIWSADGESLYFVAVDNATYDETLYRHDVKTGQRQALTGGRISFGGLQVVPSGVLTTIQSATTPPDLWHIDGDSGERVRATELNPQLARHAFSEPELFHFDNQDGDRLGALLFRATGAGAGSDEPVITYVYEKLTPGIHRFQARQQIFATHGFAVLMPNVKIKVGETGTSFVKAVIPAVEAVYARGFTNGRACLWGGSFGAYATSFVITQTNLFDCAVSRATPPELFRNWASGRDRDSDNIERGQARMGGSPFEVPQNYLSQSAFFHLDQVETPVLITHGLNDQTILFEEGAMMFYALRRLGKTATFVGYREGDHSLYRHSRADALDVHQRMLDWFALYLR